MCAVEVFHVHIIINVVIFMAQFILFFSLTFNILIQNNSSTQIILTIYYIEIYVWKYINVNVNI